MAYVKKGRPMPPRRARGRGPDPQTGGPRGGLGAMYVAEGGGLPRCPVCSSCAPDQRKGAQIHCSVCGNWSPATQWSACNEVVQVIDPYPVYPYPYPFFRGGGGHGGHHGGHHGHHGFGDDVLPLPLAPSPLPPMPAPGSADEQVALLRRVAVAQENFNKQDLRLRYIQIATVAAIPVATSVWGVVKKWWTGRKA